MNDYRTNKPKLNSIYSLFAKCIFPSLRIERNTRALKCSRNEYYDNTVYFGQTVRDGVNAIGGKFNFVVQHACIELSGWYLRTK